MVPQWFMAKKKLTLGPPGPGPRANVFLAMSHVAMSHEPGGMSLEPSAMSHEPLTLTINNRLIDTTLDSKVSKFQGFKISKSAYKSTPPSFKVS